MTLELSSLKKHSSAFDKHSSNSPVEDNGDIVSDQEVWQALWEEKIRDRLLRLDAFLTKTMGSETSLQIQTQHFFNQRSKLYAQFQEDYRQFGDTSLEILEEELFHQIFEKILFENNAVTKAGRDSITFKIPRGDNLEPIEYQLNMQNYIKDGSFFVRSFTIKIDSLSQISVHFDPIVSGNSVKMGEGSITILQKVQTSTEVFEKRMGIFDDLKNNGEYKTLTLPLQISFQSFVGKSLKSDPNSHCISAKYKDLTENGSVVLEKFTIFVGNDLYYCYFNSKTGKLTWDYRDRMNFKQRVKNFFGAVKPDINLTFIKEEKCIRIEWENYSEEIPVATNVLDYIPTGLPKEDIEVL